MKPRSLPSLALLAHTLLLPAALGAWSPTRPAELWGPTIPNYVGELGEPVVTLDPGAEKEARRISAEDPRRSGDDQVSLCVRGTLRSRGVGQWERKPAFELQVSGAGAVRRATAPRCTPP